MRETLDREIPGAKISIFTPPPVPGLGQSSGFKIIIEDRGDLGTVELQNQVDAVIERSLTSNKVENLFSVHRANVPQLFLDIDREQCETLRVNLADVFSTLEIYLGSLYVNDFNRFGRTWQVVVQAPARSATSRRRSSCSRCETPPGRWCRWGRWSRSGRWVGRSTSAATTCTPLPPFSARPSPASPPAKGIEEMERICNDVLSPGMAFEWTEINYMQIDAGKNVWNRLIFPLAVVFVFLVLAFQYESWTLPLAVILVVPMCILGSLIGVYVTGGDINIFTQIGFVVLVGLASKNAILIVEFAKHKHEEGGLSRYEATLEACRLRLRPILMTSFAFILGVVPLIVSTGAGAEMRRTLGTAVFSGMLGVTLFGIFLTPVFFYVIEGFKRDKVTVTTR